LGNESDTYGEISLTNNWLRLDEPLKTPYVRTTVMISVNTGENFSFDSLNNQAQGNDIALRQAFVEAGNVFQSMPEIRFWAGQRYYRRHDIHIDDFYYLDMSGYGAGVEDVPLGNFGKLALAWLGGSVDNYQTDHGNAAKSNIDLRIYDIKALFGKFTFWFDYSHTRGGDVHNVFDENGEPFAIQSSSGWAVGLIHRTNEPTAAETIDSKDGKAGPPPSEEIIGGILSVFTKKRNSVDRTRISAGPRSALDQFIFSAIVSVLPLKPALIGPGASRSEPMAISGRSPWLRRFRAVENSSVGHRSAHLSPTRNGVMTSKAWSVVQSTRMRPTVGLMVSKRRPGGNGTGPCQTAIVRSALGSGMAFGANSRSCLCPEDGGRRPLD
jgi:hypothetical protein